MQYIRVIRLSGSFFAREFEKPEKVRKNLQYREVDEKTVAKQFLAGEASVRVEFEDSGREDILLTNESDSDMIKRYLGTRFID